MFGQATQEKVEEGELEVCLDGGEASLIRAEVGGGPQKRPADGGIGDQRDSDEEDTASSPLKGDGKIMDIDGDARKKLDLEKAIVIPPSASNQVTTLIKSFENALAKMAG